MNFELYVTTFPSKKKKTDRFWYALVDDYGEENEVVNLYPEKVYQTVEGFGGAFTDSAGYVFSLMPQELKKRLLDAYFGPDGAGYTLGRIHLDSCDFSLDQYEALSDPKDRTFSSFSLKRTEKYILPFLKEAEKTLGRTIPLMASPWSPPAFMKSTGKRSGGGALKENCRDFWAEYLCTYIGELRKKGCDLRRITIQNEPHATQTWDSCLYSAEEEKRFIRDFLVPALRQKKLEDTEIFIWDHNKERAWERTRDILEGDDGIESLVAGVAFHWYSGNHFEALHLIQECFPALKMIQSEACIEYRVIGEENIFWGTEKYGKNLIGDLNAGMTAFYDWNMVLDERGGPNHVGNYCDAPFLYHAGTGTLEERPSYAYISHFSRYIKPGARRIAFTTYTDAIDVTAFKNPPSEDGNKETIVVVFLNRTGDLLPVKLRVRGKITALLLPPHSIATGLLAP